MGVKTAVAVGAAGVAAGLVARSLVKQKNEADGDGRHPEGWKAVTILADPQSVADGRYPEPLARIAEMVEIRVEDAPGDKGFELHARVRDGSDVKGVLGDEDPDQALRVALRDAKQVLETGEVLRAIPRPHGERPRTVTGAVVDAAEDKAKGVGVLRGLWSGQG
ncbi:hypothetical protein [Naasia lichenicola]|uniref:hypothetical protein n=1 Tax=Naasia lichenicola TaxID=2565933 RepID=UPI001E650B2C|nr:hypothetical protein [Naasia lichenicola]